MPPLNPGEFLSFSTRGIHQPNLFGEGTVGGEWGKSLRDLYSKPLTETEPYMTGSTAIRDALSKEAAGATEMLGRTTQAGGYFDSGARIAGVGDINRSKMMAYGQSLAGLLAHLNEQKFAAAAPFLAARIGEFNAYQNALGQANAEQTQRFDTHMDTAATLGSAAMGMAGGGCWIAEAIFGKDSEHTHAARFYVNLIAPEWFRDAYLRYGRKVAAVVSKSRALKAILRPAFLWMGRQTAHALGA